VKTRKLFFLFGIFSLMLLAALTGCSTGDDNSGDPSSDTKPDPIAGLPSGTVSATASADGFASTPAPSYLAEPENAEKGPGQPISVTVEVTDGYITDVTISGPNETPGVGSIFIGKAPAIIIKQNSFSLVEKTGNDNFKVLVNAVSGASYTAYGIQVAGNAAIEKIKTGN
jgi:major membrane immunogen (membrane-anchored lipoprotein)